MLFPQLDAATVINKKAGHLRRPQRLVRGRELMQQRRLLDKRSKRLDRSVVCRRFVLEACKLQAYLTHGLWKFARLSGSAP